VLCNKVQLLLHRGCALQHRAPQPFRAQRRIDRYAPVRLGVSPRRGEVSS
jgi:hypothetical protein